MTSVDKMNLDYNSVIHNASSAYIDKQFVKAHKLYTDALELANKVHKTPMVKCLLKYMICSCILESNSSEEYAEAVMVLQTMEKSLKDRFPNIYCLLAQLHCKLYRFDEGAEVLKHVEALTDKSLVATEVFYIPGTQIEIQNNAKKKFLEQLKEECNAFKQPWHKPDAICSLPDCCNITKPYVTPNKRIYFSDPAFNGMVKASCNNSNTPCLLNYHQYCWKVLKDRLYPLQKVSDKEILGNDCFTSDCKNNDTPSTISHIQKIGPDGTVKYDIKSNTVPGNSNKNESKGAIKKVINKKEKTSCSSKTDIPTTPSKKESTANKQRFDGYNDYQILTVRSNAAEIEFKSECSEGVRNEKVFLYSFFLQYIENNTVRICDLWDQFKQLKQNLTHLRNIDILSFLLGTNNFQVLDKESSLSKKSVTFREKEFPTSQKFVEPLETQLENMPGEKMTETAPHLLTSHPKPFSTSTQGLEDLYDDLMNDDSLNFDEPNDKFSEVTLKNTYSPYSHEIGSYRPSTNLGYQAGGGDAPPYSKKNTNETENASQNNTHEHEKRGTENRKLKEYISKLEKDLKEYVELSESLKTDNKNKDTELKSLKEDVTKSHQQIEETNSIISGFKERYDLIKCENTNLKKELILLIEENNKLKEKLSESDTAHLRRQEVLKTFNEEFKILEDCVRDEERKKAKVLEQSLQSEIDSKTQLIAKLVDLQYSKSSNLINDHLRQCNLRLSIIEQISEWFSQTVNINYVKDRNQYLSWLSAIHQVSIECQEEYMKIKDELESSKTVDWASLGSRMPSVPETPEESLGDIIIDALNYYKSHCEMNQESMKKSQTPAVPNMPYAMPPFYAQYSQYHHQYIPTPNYMPTGAPPGLSAVMGANGMMYPRAPIQPAVTVQQTRASHSPIKEFYPRNYNNMNSGNLALNSLVDPETQEKSAKDLEERKEPTEEELIESRKRLKQYMDNVNEYTSNAKEKLKVSPEKSVDQSTTSKKIDISSEVTNSLEVSTKPATVTDDDKSYKPRTKVAKIEDVLKLFHQKYPGSLDTDILEMLYEIRKKHNNSLDGLSIEEIVEESKDIYLESQRIHMLRYFMDEKKPSSSETSQKKGLDSKAKKELSPSSRSAWKKLEANNSENDLLKANGETECSICTGLVSNKNCYLLSCNHAFHIKCIQNWFQKDQSCPNCRVPVTKVDEFPPLPIYA